MNKLNLYQVYELGRAMAPLDKHENFEDADAMDLFLCRIRIEAISKAAILPSPSSRAAQRLVDAIVKVSQRLSSPEDDTEMDLESWRVGEALKDFETVLANDAPDIASYVVSQKGIYRTDDLIMTTERHLSPETVQLLSRNALTTSDRLERLWPTRCLLHAHFISGGPLSQ